MTTVVHTMEDNENGPSNQYEVVLRFKFTSNEFTFNDGADEELSSFESDPIGVSFDFYLAAGSWCDPSDEYEVVSATVTALRNSEEKEEVLAEEIGA